MGGGDWSCRVGLFKNCSLEVKWKVKQLRGHCCEYRRGLNGRQLMLWASLGIRGFHEVGFVEVNFMINSFNYKWWNGENGSSLKTWAVSGHKCRGSQQNRTPDRIPPVFLSGFQHNLLQGSDRILDKFPKKSLTELRQKPWQDSKRILDRFRPNPWQDSDRIIDRIPTESWTKFQQNP